MPRECRGVGRWVLSQACHALAHRHWACACKARSADGAGSEGTARLLQELQFLGGRSSLQDGVAMWETAKSVDDRPVGFGPFAELGIIEARHQCDAASLRLAILRMFEGEIEEHALVFREPPIKAARNGFLRQGECARIARKRQGRATKHVA